MISADTFRRHSAPVPTRAGIPYSDERGALGLSPTGAGGLHWGSHDSTVATPFRLLNHSYIRSCPYTQGVRCRREQSVGTSVFSTPCVWSPLALNSCRIGPTLISGSVSQRQRGLKVPVPARRCFRRPRAISTPDVLEAGGNTKYQPLPAYWSYKVYSGGLRLSGCGVSAQ